MKVMVISLMLSPFSLLDAAEDYPAFIGPGNREYLADKIQTGYYVDVFTKVDMRQKERVDKRNQIAEILNYSYQTAPQISNGILEAEYIKKLNTDNLKVEINQQRQKRENVASTNLENGFTYIPYSDGKKEFFKDGLPIRIENERVVDEFGNLSIRNTSNMQYSDRRLLTSYDAELKDASGNVSRTYWYGAKYSDDSVFYGTHKTNANKNILEYSLKELDPLGNAKVTHWTALSYTGKTLSAFSQVIEDSIYGRTAFTRSNITYSDFENKPEQISSFREEGTGSDGLPYTLNRDNITYNDKDQVTSYNDNHILYDEHGAVIEFTKIKANFTYEPVSVQFGPDVETKEPDQLLTSVVSTITQNPDGTTRTENTTTEYKYDTDRKVLSAFGKSDFSGDDGQGNTYQGSSQSYYSLYNGRPELTKTISLSESKDQDGSWKNETTTTNYTRNWYGILLDAYGLGSFLGGDGQGHNYLGISKVTYKIINGRALPFQIKNTIYEK